MRGKGCGIGLVLMAALTAACARPTTKTAPCPPGAAHLDPTTAERLGLEKLPTIPADTLVEIGNFTVRVGNLRWTYEYFDPHADKPVRSECPWLAFEWEATRRTEEARNPTMVWVHQYMAVGFFEVPVALGGCEVWNPNPNRSGEVGEGERCQYFVHVRPEWSPRWLVIWVGPIPPGPLVGTPITYVARVEVPPPPPAPER
jgi:hypothetical protein